MDLNKIFFHWEVPPKDWIDVGYLTMRNTPSNITYVATGLRGGKYKIVCSPDIYPKVWDLSSNSIQELQILIDERLIEMGYILLDEETTEKYRLLK